MSRVRAWFNQSKRMQQKISCHTLLVKILCFREIKTKKEEKEEEGRGRKRKEEEGRGRKRKEEEGRGRKRKEE